MHARSPDRLSAVGSSDHFDPHAAMMWSHHHTGDMTPINNYIVDFIPPKWVFEDPTDGHIYALLVEAMDLLFEEAMLRKTTWIAERVALHNDTHHYYLQKQAQNVTNRMPHGFRGRQHVVLALGAYDRKYVDEAKYLHGKLKELKRAVRSVGPELRRHSQIEHLRYEVQRLMPEMEAAVKEREDAIDEYRKAIVDKQQEVRDLNVRIKDATERIMVIDDVVSGETEEDHAVQVETMQLQLQKLHATLGDAVMHNRENAFHVKRRGIGTSPRRATTPRRSVGSHSNAAMTPSPAPLRRGSWMSPTVSSARKQSQSLNSPSMSPIAMLPMSSTSPAGVVIASSSSPAARHHRDPVDELGERVDALSLENTKLRADVQNSIDCVGELTKRFKTERAQHKSVVAKLNERYVMAQTKLDAAATKKERLAEMQRHLRQTIRSMNASVSER
eukprot:PhM_4_TR6957/c0_g1_i1/m.20262